MPRPSPRPSVPRQKRDGQRFAPYALATLFALALACVLAGPAPNTSHAAGAPAASRRALSFEERVAYLRAVEEVYWRRTTWPEENKRPKPSLDEVVPVEATRAKVEETLRKSDALARQWNRPVTAEQLQAEVTRMASETRQPEALRELFAALGDDPYVVAEVLARPALVDRLARSSYEADAKAAQSQESFDAWWGGARQQYSADENTPDEGFTYQLAEVRAAGADDTWSPTQALPVSTGSAAVWTGAEVIIWGGTTQYGGRTNAGSRYNPATDTWTPISTVGAPSERSGHVAQWTGTEFLVWGGLVGVSCGGDGPCRYSYTNTGGRYNPATDTWTPTSISGAPASSSGLTVWTGSKLIILGSLASNVYEPSSDTWKLTPRSSLPGHMGHRAVWTGTEIFTWGGINNDTGTRGGLYNPETGVWRRPNNFNAPSERNNFSMVWTGTEVVVWGGFEGNNVTLNTGGRYNPKTDTWTPTSTANAPAPRYGHVAVWTGSEMVVHGGDVRTFGQATLTNTGARYNPATDSWASISTTRSPVKFNHVAVWTGSEVFVWGGSTGTGSLQKEGARFNPSTDTWTPVNNNDSPLYLHQGVWTGTEMLVWGYNSLCNCFNSVGGRYDPATNVWRPMNITGAPGAGPTGYNNNLVWTGKEMLVWGGSGGRGRYNPLTDTWAAISSTGAPTWGYTAVWSGKEMIVWGSGSTGGDANTGGRYNPETDTWRPTSTTGAPTGRYFHTAVWAGSEMIVWGGTTSGVGGKHNTGGRYNPETDTWRPTSTAGVPEGRTHHTAVWTGSAMVVWGGLNDTTGGGNAALLNTGGRYDPVADAWTPTSTGGAPEPRADHRAIWTGSQMIVWGGNVKTVVGPRGNYTGARYNPATDVWTTTSTLSAPSKRSQHVQVWTGTQMIVWGGFAEEGAATHGAVYNAPGALRPGNVAPAVSLTAPAGGTSYQSGDTVQLAAEVSDPDGAVTTVRFYANGQLVGTDRQAPFAFAWGEVRGGSYALTAVATDDGNAEARSGAVDIFVAPSTAPPVCVLTAPADGSSYPYGSSVRMEATMTPNRDRAIARVEFLVDGQMVTYYEPPTYNPPYWHLYTANAAGARSLAARCTDNMGGVTTSAPKLINVEEQGFSVSGQLLETGSGAPIANIRMRLDGPAGTAPVYTTTTVGGMGNYYFGGLKPGQNYKITLEAPNWRWAPSDATFTAISRSYTQTHFYGTRIGLAITGRLTDAAGDPVYPATVYMSGSKNASAGVGFDGTYFFYGLAPGGTYTVQPYKNQHTFEPGHRTFANLSADQVADFKGTNQGKTVTLSGRIVNEQGVGLAGMVVKISTSNERTTTTGADGWYSFAGVPYGQSFGVYPSDPSNTYRFTPVSQFPGYVVQDYVVPDFVAVPITYIISGTVKDQTGRAIPGVTITLSGAASGTITTGTDGHYLFRDLAGGGDYTVRPSKEGYAFTPQAASFAAVRSNQWADFKGAPAPTPTAPVNVALASQGGTVTVSSAYDSRFAATSLNNGDRKGLNWGAGGGWNDATGNAYPDWVEVSFGGEKTINEVDVFTVQDNFSSPSEPTEAMTFSKYGVTSFDVRYWTGTAWAAVPNATATSNRGVWRRFSFPALTTSKLRVVITGALDGYSRLVEVEAWQGAPAPAPTPAPTTGRVNVALASQGATVAASSQHSANFPAPAAINGDRKGLNWGSGGGWNDGTNNAYPDWLEVTFSGAKTIDEVDVFTLQDAFSSPVEPTEATTFSLYGVTAFEAQYWTGSAWATVPGGQVTGNNKAWRRLVFAPVTTTRIRVVVNGALNGSSRLTEVEAWQVDASVPPRANHALAANGGVAAASSTYDSRFPTASVNDGDRRGANWGAGGGWNDATGNAYPDWVEVAFNGAKSVSEVNVFTVQDAYASPAEPTESMTFTKYGVTEFDVQAWDGSAWVTVQGGVTGNNLVWRKLTFPAVTTTKIRVLVRNGLGGYSRITEVEAY